MKIDNTTDTTLVEKFQNNGSEEAFEELARRYLPMVRRLMFNLTQNEADADDLSQEAFMRVYRNLPGFRSESKFSTWLYRVSINTARSFLRKNPARHSDVYGCPEDIPARASDEPGASLLSREADRAVGRALAELPADFRTAIVLTSIEGLDYDEAARAANCNKATLYWRVHRARKTLKLALGEYL